jgi:hypothetical protein
MAGYVGDGYRGLDGRLSKEVQAELGILAIPLKQCVVDYLGSQRWRLRAYYFAALPFFLEYQRSSEESLAVNLIPQPTRKWTNQNAPFQTLLARK